MANFLRTLLRPDRDDEPERAEVSKAANLLQIGEFQLLQLAYFAWHGEELPESANDRLFRAYMIKGQIPPWARHYARRVIALAERGELDDGDPRYHRYDVEYFKALPLGVRRFAMAVCCLAFVLVGAIALGEFTVVNPTSILPPYFESDDLPALPPEPADEPPAR